MPSESLWETAFTPFRRKILYPIAASGALLLLPLAVYDFMQGKHVVGVILLCIVAMLATDAFALHRREPPPFPFAFLMIPAYAGVGIALATQGMEGALWSYPVVFLAFFVLPQRSANTIGLALAAMGTLLLGLSHDPGTVWRYIASMALCFVVINVMLNIVTTLQGRLMQQSITDPLTGAFNRRHMDATLAEVVERYRRTGAPASAMLIDIDHFKQINDRLGHAAGDEALRGLVALVRSRRRRLDMLFRQGGEEFLLLLPDTRVAEARRLAEALRESVAQATILRGEKLTVSIGVGEVQPAENAHDWIDRVDEALYRAKEEGRDCVIAVGFAPWPVQPVSRNAPSTRAPTGSTFGTSPTVLPSVPFPPATPVTRQSANT